MRTYTVQQGDSLSLISEKFFGDWDEVDQIAKLNNITDKDVIYPGQILTLPDPRGVALAKTWVIEEIVLGWLPLVALGVGAYLVYKHTTKPKKTS